MHSHRVAILLTAGILLARAVGLAALVDPLGAPLPVSWRLDTPWLYGVLAPLFSLWDQVAMLSRSRLSGFLVGLAAGYVAWRAVVRRGRRVRWQRMAREEVGALTTSLVALALFVAAGMAWNTRPSRRLVGLGSEELTVEVHSHSNVSHDVKAWPVSGFDVAASVRWHERAGIDVLFITDHNLTTGWERHGLAEVQGEPRICPGMEVSAFGAHVVVLGSPLPVDPSVYRGTPENRARLFQEVARAPGVVAIASLPEYRGEAAEFLAEGVGGFEIVNASPKANEFTRVERDSVVALAQAANRAVLAAGDQHGYGATPMAWNVLRLPGWRRQGDSLCTAVVSALRAGGPSVVRIAERTRLRPDHLLPGVLTPLGVLWLAWATLTPAGIISWLAWIWLVSIVGHAVRIRLRRRRAHAILTAVGAFPTSLTGDA